MRSYYITFRSVTYAQRGESVLQRYGISCTLQRAPRHMEERGCGYALGVRQGDIHSAVQVLRQQQVSFRKVYTRLESGALEEVAM